MNSRPESKRSRLPRAGFTLIEVMLVVGLIAMIMALGIPAFVQARQKTPMRQAISDVMEAVSAARAQAILRGVAVDLVVRPGAGTFSVAASGGDEARAAAGGGNATAGFSAQLSRDVLIVILGVNFVDRKDEDEVRARFHPNGTSDAFSVALRSAEGETQVISVEMVSGLAYLETPK